MKVWRRESAHFIVGAVVILLLAVAGWFIWTNFMQSKTVVRIESGVFQVGVATNQSTRDSNLGSQTTLDANGGILLAYSSDNYWQVATEGLHVAVDILWLDKEKHVVHIVRNVSPETGNDTVYTPQKPARYILEIPAGKAKESGVKTGSTAVFTIDEARIE